MSKKNTSLVPSTAPQPLSTADHERLGKELTAAYHEAIDGHLRVLAFGAKFMEVEKVVSTCGHNSTRGPQTKGTGMKAWLEQHAPAISRPTAYRFRDIADGVATKFGIKEPARFFSAPVAKLAAPEQAKREKISAFMADKSMRQVQLELGLTNPTKDTDLATGKRVHHPARRTPAELQEEWTKAARARATETFSDLHDLDDRWKLLDDAHLKVTLADAKKLVKDLTAWLETPEPVRVGCEIERHLLGTGAQQGGTR